MNEQRRGGFGCWVWGLMILFLFPLVLWALWRLARWWWGVTAPAEGDSVAARRWKLAGRVALVAGYIALAAAIFWPTSTAVPGPAADSPPPAPTAVPAAADCYGIAYDRDSWGGYPTASPNARPRWTTPADRVNAPAIQQDHHVSLQNAHFSGGCRWSAVRKNAFASDPANLNPTTASFNASKGSRTPDRLTGIARDIIDTDRERCEYALQHTEVKLEYGLTFTAAELDTLERWVDLC